MKAILFCFFSFFSGFDLHPLHVSVTEINYDEKEKALEIMMRVFMDDLETTMRERHNFPELDILNPSRESLDEMMKAYLTEKLSVHLDRKPQSLRYLGHERDGDAFVFYVEIEKVRKWKGITVMNSILIEKFDDQSNLVHVTAKGTVRSLRLNKNNPSGDLSFE